MNIHGFHLTSKDQRLGRRASPQDVERAEIAYLVQPRAWEYDRTPEGITGDRYYYTVEDLCVLMDKSHNTIRALAQTHGWRYRFDKRFNTKGYYLYDLIVTVWTYMLDWPGNRVDPELVAEAQDYHSGIPSVSELGVS